MQVDAFGTRFAYARNIEREYERNFERYALLRWAQSAFGGFRVVPPGMGIVHQVNLEHLGRVVQLRQDARGAVAVPDTLVGTDSHTTMIDALGILGWGVGGIEAEAVLLGEPLVLGTPVVVGVEFRGRLRTGVTATDLVLTLTEMLRRHGVVGKFVEFCGDGLSALTVPDRATLSNMAPEYGATASTFPVDAGTLRYLDATGRGDVTRPGRGVHPRAGHVPRGRRRDPRLQRAAGRSTSTPSSRASPARGARRTASRSRRPRASFHDAYPREPNPARLNGARPGARGRHRGDRGAGGATSRSTTAPS